MFDTWDDYAKAVFNPAASTYDMIIEAEAGFSDMDKENQQAKRDKALAEAKNKAKIEEINAEARTSRGVSPDGTPAGVASRSGGLRSGGAASTSTPSTGQYVAGVGLVLIVGAGVWYYYKKKGR